MTRHASVAFGVRPLVGKPHPGRLMTPQEVADVMRVSRSTVLRWARDGQVACVTMPSGRLRFRITDLPGFGDAD